MNKYKKLLGNTVVFGIGQFASKLLGFLLVALYTRVLTKPEYSTADILYQTVNVLVPLVTFSMADAVIRFGMDNNYDCRKVYTTVNFCVLGGMAIFMLFTPLVNSIQKLSGYSFLLFVYCYFSCFRQMASQFVRARGYVKLFMADGVFSTFMQVIFNLIFLLGFKLGVTGYVLSIVLSDALSICLLTLIARLGRCLDTRFFDKELLKELLRFSAPLIPTYLLWWITSASDRYFMIYMIGDEQNAVYSLGNKLPTLLMLVTTMFYQAWQMSSIEERDSRTLGKFYENVFSAYSSFLFVAAAGLIMMTTPLNLILAGRDEGELSYSAANLFTPILIVAMLFQCFCQFTSSVYTTKKRSVNSCLTALVAASVNLILNALLIPQYSWFGAAIATAASYFACFAVRIFDTRRYIFFKVDYARLAVNTVITLLMCILAAKQPEAYWVGLIFGFGVSAVYNFSAIIRTLRKILARGNAGGRAQNAAG